MGDRKINDFFNIVTPRSTKRQRASSSPDVTISPTGEIMDTEKVGQLTQGQLMACLSSLLDEKMSKLATKEFLVGLTKKVEALQEENEALRCEIASIKKQESLMFGKIVDLEARSRRNNLIFRGLKVPEGTTNYSMCIRRLCKEVLGTDEKLYVNRAHPLGKDRSTITCPTIKTFSTSCHESIR